jgi:hypothetical protein
MRSPTTAAPTQALAWCLLSATLFAFQLSIMAHWATAFHAGSSQAERVSYFLGHLPLGLGTLGVTNLTMLCITVGVAGVIAAFAAHRLIPRAQRVLSVILAAGNGILVFWYGFTLM